MRAFIAGIGTAVPEKILTNADLEKMVETSNEWIITRSGIKERRIAGKDVATSDLALAAGKKALAKAGVAAAEIGAVIVATATPDMLFPSTACLVQSRIGAKKVMSFDVSAGCSGFVYGLGIADSMIKSGLDNILVIGAETLTKVTDFTDRSTCVLLGDGAGAVLLKKDAGGDRGIASFYLAADGAEWKFLHMPAGGSRVPASHESIDQRMHYLKMEGKEVFKLAVRAMLDAAYGTLKRANLTTKDVTFLVPHQANIRIIEATADRLGIPMERVCINLDKYGNTSAASIPIALNEAIEDGRVKQGDYVLMVAFGAGFTWGGVLVKM